MTLTETSSAPAPATSRPCHIEADAQVQVQVQVQAQAGTRKARVGDIVTVDLDLRPEDGFVPERLFDTSGRVSFVLGWGNYLPGLHALAEGMAPGESARGVSIDAGWGERNPDLVVRVPLAKVVQLAGGRTPEVGDALTLQGGIEVTVVQVTDETATVDANPPLAGSSYGGGLEVISVDELPNEAKEGSGFTDFDHFNDHAGPFAVATFAMGCFWGAELAFMRVPGVVGTRVGYTQGEKQFPSYEEVCQGDTKHRESVHVVYDTRVVSYARLLEVYMERLSVTAPTHQATDLFAFEHESTQYKHGIYFHSDKQRKQAQDAIGANDNQYKVEILQAARFYHAESYHQQYLLKGGQSARKGCKETIRCFG